jgi:hypothetical protein
MLLRHSIQAINTNNMETAMIGRAICCARRATLSKQGTPALHLCTPHRLKEQRRRPCWRRARHTGPPLHGPEAHEGSRHARRCVKLTSEGWRRMDTCLPRLLHVHLHNVSSCCSSHMLTATSPAKELRHGKPMEHAKAAASRRHA